MSIKNEIDALHLGNVESQNMRQVVYPAAAVGTAVISDGAAVAWAWAAYVVMVVAGTIADPCWLCGIHFHTNAVETFYGDVAIAIGAVGFEVDLAIIPVRSIFVGATAQLDATLTDLPILLPVPIKIVGSPALSARIRKDTGVSAAGGTVKAICLTGLGT